MHTATGPTSPTINQVVREQKQSTRYQQHILLYLYTNYHVAAQAKKQALEIVAYLGQILLERLEVSRGKLRVGVFWIGDSFQDLSSEGGRPASSRGCGIPQGDGRNQKVC